MWYQFAVPFQIGKLVHKKLSQRRFCNKTLPFKKSLHHGKTSYAVSSIRKLQPNTGIERNLTGMTNLTQLFSTLSNIQLWKYRKFAFDSYYRYLASLDACYLENFSIRNAPPKIYPKSYQQLCASTYHEVSKQKNVFKVLKFRAKQAKTPLRYNNEIFGLRIEDVLKSEA